MLLDQAALSRDAGNWSEARAAAGRAERLVVQLGSDRQARATGRDRGGTWTWRPGSRRPPFVGS